MHCCSVISENATLFLVVACHVSRTCPSFHSPSFEMGASAETLENGLTNDWGLFAYAVGVGGSMLWFGSSAGVAVANRFGEVRSTLTWLRRGWHVPVAFILGFFVQYALLGWNP